MAIELRKSFDSGFNLTEEELRNIYSIALSQIKAITDDPVEPSFKLRLENAFTTVETSLEYILSKDNRGQEAIHSLTITLSARNKVVITINFDADVPPNAISYTIVSDDRHWAYLTSSRLEDAIAKVKTFSPSSRRFKLFSSFSISAVSAFLLALIANLFISSWDKGIVTSSLVNTTLLILPIILLGIGVYVGFALFPSHNFYWGDYVETVDKRRALSRVITYSTLLVLGTSILASIIASYLAIR